MHDSQFFSSVLRENCGTTLVIMVQTTGNDLSKAQAHEKVFMHIREKPNKSSQCNFSNSQTGNLMRHIKSHRSKKTNKCSKCYFITSLTGNLKAHLKTHCGEKSNVTSVTLYSLSNVIWGHTSKLKAGKSQIFATYVTLNPLIKVHWVCMWKLTVETSQKIVTMHPLG